MTDISRTAPEDRAEARGVPSRARYAIVVMLFITVVINYLDRSNLSIAAPVMAKELGFDPVHMGYVLSAFGWTYALCQIPGGWFVDRVPPRVLYPVLLILWSLATIALGFSYSIGLLIFLRLLIGALEAPSYPINSLVATAWFPEKERATAIAIYTSGQFLGLAFLLPVLVWIQHAIGWHMVFVVTGLIGIVWGIIWYLFYRDPLSHKGANAAEIQMIRDGGGIPDMQKTREKSAKDFQWRDLRYVLSSRKLWGVYFGQFCLTSTLWFFLTWFPTYLVQAKGMDFVKAGFLASLPFLAAFVGILVSGFLSDWLVRRGASLGLARKAPIVTGLLLSCMIIGANFVQEPAAVIFFMAIAFFGNGLASITWSLVSALAPERLLGLTGGVFNFVGNLSGICVPIVVGYLAGNWGFSAGLTYVATLALLGALSYIMLVGKIERLPGPKPE
ncbi:MFS transporter [Sinirhodobacter populi]|uniref:MFS transporter n=1 Tax=Paenirhodobacter populi TaxID=2306993 RepID=A0A443KEY9_9RHOB|nr:MFS transporter [Sinirhodobacter populi]RWR31256.1 MFS transporter [Sinirhodobacter populi]